MSGIFLGGVIGSIAALLFAPEEGGKTRSKIEAKWNQFILEAEKMLKDVQGESPHAVGEMINSIEEGLDRLSQAVEEAKRAAKEKEAELEGEK